MIILLTGGTGYIASHTAVIQTNAGHEVVLFDNLLNNNASVFGKLEKITKRIFNRFSNPFEARKRNNIFNTKTSRLKPEGLNYRCRPAQKATSPRVFRQQLGWQY
jgi:nucleoside-diphosphate-sugar epimerase